ncbi:ABC transporter ATP-binding protein [Achromobacter aloeverae]|uniref:ABC transporter ATP-binding protein n=1 Tax=Achromobacter aloeverae TaxID=1750518 RepID=A0A4Q1HJV1_9BURK|nr:ABC transporter ATP-binding protein [Achromobacter aloeverae]RXN90219.1 ABC transporter ATP-binding protein [Achromobacter aloeverae]
MVTDRAFLLLDDIQVRYGDAIAVDRIDLAINAGEFVALLGPSGCGKTTLLRVIAGFIRANGGAVMLDGVDISTLSPEDRRIGMVFQNYALFPHMTVAENIAYGLRSHRAPKALIASKVQEMLEVVRMAGFDKRLPRALSGGQQQRVALARALAISPRLLLLDEPLGALDKNLREEMQAELLRIQRELGITTIMVTHDQEEAMSMADRIAILNRGQVVQFGTATEIYDAPSTAFVSGFVGNSTFLDGLLGRGDGDQWTLRTSGGVELRFLSAGPCRRAGAARIALRPEQMELCDDGVAAVVRYARPMGPSTRVGVSLEDGTELQLSAPRDHGADSLPAGARVRVRIKPQAHCPVFLP